MPLCVVVALVLAQRGVWLPAGVGLNSDGDLPADGAHLWLLLWVGYISNYRLTQDGRSLRLLLLLRVRLGCYWLGTEALYSYAYVLPLLGLH